jgi:hypothetical protein
MDYDISKKRKTKWEASDASSGDDNSEDYSITKRLKKEKKERKKKKKKLKEYEEDIERRERGDTMETERESRSGQDRIEEATQRYSVEQGYTDEAEMDGEAEAESDDGDDEFFRNIRIPPVLEGPFITPCRHVDNYEKLNKIAEGAYGVVYRARDRSTGEIVALKKLKLSKEKNGFPITSLREIYALLLSKHRHIVNVIEVVCGDNPNK